jgi:hypothetical protein
LKALEDIEFFKYKYEDALGDIASLKHALNKTSDIKF